MLAEPNVLLQGIERRRDATGERTYPAPVHERAASMGCGDRGEGQGGVVGGLDVRDEVPAVESAHGVREEVDASRGSLGAQELVEVRSA